MNVYDFDETIYNGESTLDFFLYFFRKDPTLVKFLPAVLKELYLYKREKISLDEFISDYAATVEGYIKTHKSGIEKCVNDFWDKKMNKIKPFYAETRKEDDVIVSASPDFLLKEICSRIGIKNVICTHIDLETGKLSQPCFREAKIDCFRAVYPECEIDDFYTDSMNDKFLMPLAKRVFLVKGNEIKQIK